MLNKLKAIFFDLDDVIIQNKNKEGRYLWSLNIAKNLGVDEDEMRKDLFGDGEAWGKVTRGKVDIRELVNKFLNKNNYSITTEEFVNCFLIKYSTIDHRVLNSAKKLKEKGYKLYIATHQIKERSKHFWEKENFKEYFDDIFIPEYVGGYVKKEPQFFETIRNRVNFKPIELLMIDDKIKNINTAKSVGWQGYHYTDYNKANEELFNKLTNVKK